MENMELRDNCFKKEMKNCVIKLFLFIATVKYFFVVITFLLFVIFYPIVIIMAKLLLPVVIYLQENWKVFSLYDSKNDAFLNSIILVSSFIGIYFIAKIYGIFKKLNKFNVLIALLILFAISTLLICSGHIKICTPDYIYYLGIHYSYTMYLLLPAFLLYKFFNFLTKKFPTPFQQIGYFFSIEFYKNIYKKLKNRQQN